MELNSKLYLIQVGVATVFLILHGIYDFKKERVKKLIILE